MFQTARSSVLSFVAAVLATAVCATPAFAATGSVSTAGRNVVDYSSGFNALTPATLKQAGVGVVVRYVGSSAWKCLSPAEATALRSNGIDIAAVYETSAGWMLGGRAAGIAAAQAARADVIAAGGPQHPFVYFACDTPTTNYAQVNAALFGAQSVLGAENVGIYGSYSVCDNALKAGAAAKAWQTVAWSNGRVLPGISLLQLVPPTLGNLGVDYDSNIRYSTDIGQWGALRRTSVPSTPLPAQVQVPSDGLTVTRQSVPTTANLSAVDSTDGVSAWVVGENGTILQTGSAGATWTAQSVPTSDTLCAVDFTDGSNGWAAGEHGTILQTPNGGVIWQCQSTPTTQTLRSISFADGHNGWAVGEQGTVLHTSDAGLNWEPQSVPTTTSLNYVRFSNKNSGVAFGDDGAFLFTGNGGKSWFKTSTPTTTTLSAYGLMSATEAWSVGASGTALYTADDGATWIPRSVPTTSALQGVAFADSTHGVAVGASGTVLFTRDAGECWAKQSVAATSTLGAVTLNGTRGWAVGEDGTVLRLQVGSSR